MRANCFDEEAGLISYLSFYYCNAGNAQPVAFIVIALWLGLLFSTIGIAASDFFCINLSTISTLLGLSESLAGVTFLAFGNGSPDVFSTFAAMGSNSGSLAIGELIGAAGFITAVVAGSMAFVRPFKVAKKSFVRDVGFFIIAASFSLVFLYDGKLYLWESASMVGLYLFYVVFVVIWHWLMTRRRRKRQTEVVARAQYIIPGSGAAELGEEYHDEEEDRDPRDTQARAMTVEDFDALERAGFDANDDDEDEQENFRDRWLAEINQNMRLSRPRPRERRNTHNPIRPSLVGALEFRSVLSGLQKSRNIQSYSLHLRRFSDDAALGLPQDQFSHSTDPRISPPYPLHPDTTTRPRPSINRRTASGNRARAASAVEANTLRHTGGVSPLIIPTIDLLAPFPEDAASHTEYEPTSSPADVATVPRSPTISISPPPSDVGSQVSIPPPHRASSPTLLAPPDSALPGRQARTNKSRTWAPKASTQVISDSHAQSMPSRPISSSSNTQTGGNHPFPVYADSSVLSLSPASRFQSPQLPPQNNTLDSRRQRILGVEEQIDRPLSWWPYKVLPPPKTLLSTLFPTLYSWNEKNYWEKALGVVAAPSVLLLTITLPVVETERDDVTDEDIPELSLAGTFSSFDTVTPSGSRSATSSNGDAHRNTTNVPDQSDSTHLGEAFAKAVGGHGTSATVPEHHSIAPLTSNFQLDRPITYSPEQIPLDDASSSSGDWNRWLIILQVFTAPFFIVLILWVNTNVDNTRWLLRPSLFSLVFSLITLAFILATTDPNRPPRWRIGLCFLGFLVSIAWISTIAGEVVGVLKALGVILNISDAILGLTIFAVGNSLGDLVADITVARLGYPVMALSACFGGPMLNILLGVGLSGMYMTIKGAHDRKLRHPDRAIKFKPFHIDVDRTLMVSGAALLVTLIGLLIVVPLRGWRMDRATGWGLMALWAIATVGNVGLELWGGLEES